MSQSAKQANSVVPRPAETLDPSDWSGVAELAHRMVDDAVDHICNVRRRPVWQPMPPELV